MRKEARFPCPSCGYIVFTDLPGSYDICPICFWEDDIVQLAFPDMAGGANSVSLIEAQSNFTAHGVCKIRFKEKVRPAKEEDRKDEKWRPISTQTDAYLHCDSKQDGERWNAEKNTLPREKLYYWRENYWIKGGPTSASK